MRNKMLSSAFIVVVITLITASLAGIWFVQLALADYLVNVQAEKVEPLLTYFHDYYVNNDGWNNIDKINVNQVFAELTPPDIDHYDLALIDQDGIVIMVKNQAHKGIYVSRNIRGMAIPLIVEGKRVGYLFSGNFLDHLLVRQDHRLLFHIILAIFGAMTVGLIVGYLLSVVMTGNILKPIRTSIEAVKQISRGDFSYRVPLEPYHDISDLGQAVNDMAVTLEKNHEIQRIMLMDIAHDLRTPLSVQRASIEAFQDGIYPFDQSGITLLKEQNDQLIWLVEDLRLLALAETGHPEVNKEPVGLNEFVENLLAQFSTIFAKKSIQYWFNPEDEKPIVNIDSHLMTRVIENLFQNAYQHSPVNSIIEVQLRKKADLIVITIKDQGPGIPIEKLASIFQRYYRIIQAESGRPESLGLGLAISKRIVNLHGGNLFAQNSEDGGAVFVIELPFSDTGSLD